MWLRLILPSRVADMLPVDEPKALEARSVRNPDMHVNIVRNCVLLMLLYFVGLEIGQNFEFLGYLTPLLIAIQAWLDMDLGVNNSTLAIVLVLAAHCVPIMLTSIGLIAMIAVSAELAFYLSCVLAPVFGVGISLMTMGAVSLSNGLQLGVALSIGVLLYQCDFRKTALVLALGMAAYVLIKAGPDDLKNTKLIGSYIMFGLAVPGFVYYSVLRVIHSILELENPDIDEFSAPTIALNTINIAAISLMTFTAAKMLLRRWFGVPPRAMDSPPAD